ncbi:hypothetical protein [Flavobacterium eburneipallidum]|uniref:hypothetical protein n=1 Tax=Flavobacterium eburneipallidum TaxID=3003263 RepID=UPI0022ABF1FD|nr:hypothetical protein [Flavobacterium eburneipallidum]
MSELFVENLSEQLTQNNSNIADPLTTQAINEDKHEKRIVKIKGIHQNIEERKKYASYIYSFTCVWCLGLFFFLYFQAVGLFHLSDLVITTLIGSTTINILVFFRLVTAYLFNKDKST